MPEWMLESEWTISPVSMTCLKRRKSPLTCCSGSSPKSLAIIDPKTGLPTPDTYITSRYTDERIDARRTHYEDWLAVILFNHLFSGADAYVAANLWDFKTNVGVVATPGGAGIYATVRLR